MTHDRRSVWCNCVRVNGLAYDAGYAAPSFGLNCAHMAGMRGDIIERAAQVRIQGFAQQLLA